MTREGAYKLAFLLLMLALFTLFCKNVFAIEKNIAIDVEPKVTTTGDYNTKSFRVRVTIPRNRDNRLWSYTASCGQEIHSSEHEMDKDSPVTYTWFEELTVTEDCIFQACLHRQIAGKIKNFCNYQEVRTDAYDPF